MNRVGLIALDLDGTLVSSDHLTVTQENIEAIRRADACGVRVTISTGRALEDASDMIHRLNIPCMIIGSNGARASDGPLPEGNIFIRKQLLPKDAHKAIDLLLESGLMINGFEDGVVNTVEYGTGWMYHSAKRGLLRANYGIEALRAAADRGLIKLFAVAGGFGGEEADERVPIAREAIRRELPHLQLTNSAAGNLEVMPADASKGIALAEMAAHLGLTREQVMAVGDEGNDMSMLLYAYHSVAMGNASPEVKAACRYLTATNDESGVARIIERVLEQKGVSA